MDAIFGIIFFVGAVQLLMIIIGTVMCFSSVEKTAKTGKTLLFTGLILFGVEILIGFALCSKL